MWITDPKTGEKSVSLTMMLVGFGFALVRVVLSGIDLGFIKFATFSGSEFALIFSPLAALYWGRKKTDTSGGIGE